MSKAEEKPYLQDLFEHMSNEHGLTLLQTEMQEIIDICLKQNDYNYLSTENAQLKEALRELVKEIETNKINWLFKEANMYRCLISPENLDKAKQLLNKE